MPKIAIARIWFESNSFCPRTSTLRDLQIREWTAGPAAIEQYRGTGTELGGVASFADQHPNWSATVLRCASAQPAGPFEDSVLDAWLSEVIDGLTRESFDAVYLSLHGACQTVSDPAADLTIIRRVRAAIGNTPLGASFDLHANLSPEIADLLDCASAYRTYPHIDMAEAALRALQMLAYTVEGRARLHGAAAKLPRVLHSFNMRSAAGPMAELLEIARIEESQPGVHDVALFGGFAWGDSPYAGPTALVFAEERAQAEAVAQRMMRAMEERIPRFDVSLPGPEDGLRQALACPPGLVALLDPADNPFSGGIADTPGLLAVLANAQLDVPTVFAFLRDPTTVQKAQSLGEGAEFRAALGGHVVPHFGPPVALDVTVERLTDGRFVNTGPMECGATVDLGPTALLRAGAMQIIVTSECQSVIDPACFALHGIDLNVVRLLAVKGKNHFRAAFAERCVNIIDCDCPGPAATDLRNLPFRHVPQSWR